jgi:hypothetical protein
MLVISGAAAAEAQKNAAGEPSKPASAQVKPAVIVLASADAPRSPATDNPQATQSPAKRRVAPRVTTCRCGDPQILPDPENQ